MDLGAGEREIWLSCFLKIGDEVGSIQRGAWVAEAREARECGADANVWMWVKESREGPGSPEPGLGVLPLKRARNRGHKGRDRAAIRQGSREAA